MSFAALLSISKVTESLRMITRLEIMGGIRGRSLSEIFWEVDAAAYTTDSVSGTLPSSLSLHSAKNAISHIVQRMQRWFSQILVKVKLSSKIIAQEYRLMILDAANNYTKQSCINNNFE